MNNIKTAADKIRAMSNDELAEFLAQTSNTMYSLGLEHAVRFKHRMITYDVFLEHHKTLLNKNADEVDFGPLPEMGS